MTRHRAKTIQRQQQTLEAAMRIVLEEGPDQLTIVRLAKEIGASVGGLYRYFPSKEALIFELQKQSIAEFDAFQSDTIAKVEAAAEGADTDVAVLAQVVAAFIAYPAHRTHDEQRHGLLTAFLTTPRKVLSDEKATQIQESISPLLERCVRRMVAATEAGAMAQKEVPPAYTLWAALHGLDDFRKRDRVQPAALQVRSLLPDMLETFLVGWGADRVKARSAVALTLQKVAI